MSAFIAELEARFDDERGRDLDALIDELTDAWLEPKGTSPCRCEGVRRSPARCSTRPARGCSCAEVATTA